MMHHEVDPVPSHARHNRTATALLAATLGACSSPTPDTPVTDAPDRPGTSTSPFDGVRDTGSLPQDTADSDRVPVDPPFDCVNLPALPTTWTELTHVRGSEEFGFDADGYLVNISDASGALLITPYSGDPQPLTTYPPADLAGIAMLASGGVALCDEGRGVVVRIERDGTREELLTGVNSPNSITVGADGHLFMTAYDEIWEYDPVNGASYRLIEIDGHDLDGLTFDPTFRTLYFNHDSGGVVGAIDLVSPGEITNARVVTGLPASGELDGATVDICGNVYVVVTNGEVFRVSPSGDYELVLDLSGWVNTTAIRFGSGVGGWERDHLYVMNRQGSVFDVPLGIPGRPEPHYPTVP
jgi:hypothetical protein